MFGLNKKEKASDSAPHPATVGRNDSCHCGSGKKYKKCCEAKDEAARHTLQEKEWQKAAKILEKQNAEEPKSVDASSHTVPGKPAAQQPKTVQPRHNTFAAPKFNTPRRTGGG